jgi:heptosyltransferase-3
MGIVAEFSLASGKMQGQMPGQPKPRRIAVICTRRLGDVLLATALIRSLRRVAQPGMRIEALVFPETAAALAGNPDLDAIIAVPHRPSLGEAWRLLLRIFRRYELAVSTVSSDRAHALALLCSSRRVCMIPPLDQPGARWKRWLSWRSLRASDHVHTVEQTLRLAERIGIPRWPQVVPPRPADATALDAKLGAGWHEQPFAVMHPAAMYPYKGWTDSGWRALLAALVSRGLKVYLTGGPAAAERALVEKIAAGADQKRVVNLAGQFAFAELTPLIEKAGVFVGPDTSVTHLAAATGTPTIALFGPSSPVAWGPWPYCGEGRSPAAWKMTAPLQHQGNVWIVQGLPHCVPCLKEGCRRHQQSDSVCLDEMPAARVVAIVEQALASIDSPAAGA